MGKHTFAAAAAGLLTASLTGCTATNEKSIGLWVVYAVAVLFSVLIELGYCLNRQGKNRWFLLLFSSVLVVNTGYLLLSVSGSLEAALHANRLSYLGSVFLPLSMLMIIMNVCKIRYSKWLPRVLIGISILVFLITASPGYLDLYYKEVTIEQVHGITVLNKVYGPLHPSYLFYLLGYFCTMIFAIFFATIKRRIEMPSYAAILASAVFVNICVWLVEKFVRVDFELLSISYIITAVFLLGLNYLDAENAKHAAAVSNTTTETAPAIDPAMQEKLDFFSASIHSLTRKETEVFLCYVQGMSTQEVLEHLGIKENTLKFHNKHIYEKLGVTSRRQLLEFYKLSGNKPTVP